MKNILFTIKTVYSEENYFLKMIISKGAGSICAKQLMI